MPFSSLQLIFPPFLIKYFKISNEFSDWDLHTIFKGELCVELFTFISDPFLIKYLIILKFPFSHEIVNGVLP